MLEPHPDGGVTHDPDLLDSLIVTMRARARARGSRHVTERDVRDAAHLVTQSGGVKADSPADDIPVHYDTLLRELARIHEAVAQSKSGGGRPPRVLVIGETSGVISRAFRSAGADAANCDLEPSVAKEVPHFLGDFSYIYNLGWDLVIGHPPCTYLANAGVRFVTSEPGRMDRVREAADVFLRMIAVDAPYVALEQPIIHRHARALLGELTPSQYVQLWQHGTGHIKTTCLYLSSGLPPLTPTHEVPGRIRAMANLPASPRRGEQRSRTYLGIAGAMAAQWTPILLEYLATAPKEVGANSLRAS
jgi:hypothetical protein